MGGERRREGGGIKQPKKPSRSSGKKVLVAETPVKFQGVRLQQVVSASPGNVIEESPRRSFYSGVLAVLVIVEPVRVS